MYEISFNLTIGKTIQSGASIKTDDLEEGWNILKNYVDEDLQTQSKNN